MIKNFARLFMIPVLVAAGAGMRFDDRAIALQELQDAIDEQIHLSPAKLFDLPIPRTPRGRIHPKLVQFYHERDMLPLWTTASGPNANAATLRAVLGAADSQGLNPADYSIDQINRYWDRRETLDLARLELLLTLALGDYVSDLVEGRRHPREFDPKLFPTACDCDIDPALLAQQAINAPDLKAFLEEQAPPFPQYRQLRDKLAEFRTISAQGGWPQIEPGQALKPGLQDPRIPTIRRRLSITGELPTGDPLDGLEYDEIVMTAVKQFQRHHDLKPDGILERATLAAMNVPVAKRINQIIVNLESWRWVGRDSGDWFLIVNIPSFELQGIRNNNIEMSTPVIVGEQYSTKMTPVFSDRVRYVEFNPYWNVPKSIARREMLPELKKDPSYLKKKNIRLFEGIGPAGPEIDSSAIDWAQVSPEQMDRYRLRQDPGPDNSLGTVELAFPNQFDVYLHDTPAKDLFQQPKRAFSHGCIRVARPQEVAAYVLGGEAKGWDEDRVKAVIAEGKSRIVHLESSLPIYILYHTAVVNPNNNELYFYNDIYGRDAILEKALF